MQGGSLTVKRHFVLAASGLGLLSLSLGARADVTVVSRVTVTGLPIGGDEHTSSGEAGSPQTVTTYYKGSRARSEVAGGPVLLFDAAGDTVYRLNPAAKTYSVLSLKRMQEGQGGLSGTMADRMTLDAKADLKAADMADTRTIAGLTARRYDVTGSVSAKPKESGGGGLLGGIFGGGGFPGGGGGGGFPGGGGGGFPGGGGGRHHRGGGRGRGPGGSFPATTISGEVWLSDALRLPNDKKASMLPAVQELLSGGGPALKPLADALGKKKLLPLDSTITVTRPARAPRGDDQNGEDRRGNGDGGEEQGGDQPGRAAQTITTTVQVQSLSQEPLPDALFQLPASYTQVTPPPDESASGEASRS